MAASRIAASTLLAGLVSGLVSGLLTGCGSAGSDDRSAPAPTAAPPTSAAPSAPAGLTRSAYVGVVKWFNEAKGYGFISVEGRDDVFVHHSEIKALGFRNLEAGDRVEFELAAGPRGEVAKEVIKIG